MLNLFRQDLLLIKKSINSHLLWIFLVLPFFILSIRGTEDIGPLLLSVGYIMFFFTINYGKDNMDNHIVIGYLPVNNREIVLEKYILLFFNYIIGIVYSFFILYILSLFAYDHIKYITMGGLSRVTFILFFSGSIILPLYFYLTSRWFSFWSMVVLVLIANMSRIIIGENPILVNTNPIIFFLMALIIYILSLISSIYIYKNRDI